MEDVLIIGAGIFGLSLARKLKQAGRQVRVVDRVGLGGGASATPLGVLAPHAPDRWNEKKQAQFEALSSLPGYLEALESETGLPVGYQRSGRLIPLRTENLATIWRARVEDAQAHWGAEAAISIEEPDPAWLSPEAAAFGAARCGLSAKLDARAYLAALARSIDDRIEGGYALTTLEEGKAGFEGGEEIRANLIVLANGAEAFRFLPDQEGEPAGRGEWGSLAVFRLAEPQPQRPILFERGCYVVPRGPQEVAVGVSSAGAPAPEKLVLRIEEAKRLCPALEGAELLYRWEGVRPRAAHKLILNGPHPDIANVWVATGGFKTGLALAHTLKPPC